MTAPRCARGPESAEFRIRWFVMGRSMPMFDVCAEHLDAERRVAELLNRGRETPQLRVRVSELPEQLTLDSWRGWSRTRDCWAVLRLYRSCRDRDMRPWEALAYVRALVHDCPGDIAAVRVTWMLDYIDGRLRPVVDRWFAESARQVAEVDRYLRAPDLLAQLADLTGRR